MATHYITTEVGIELDDFHDDDLIEELQDRNYIVIRDGEGWVSDAVFSLYQEWLAYKDTDEEKFKKHLKMFFSEMLNKNII